MQVIASATLALHPLVFIASANSTMDFKHLIDNGEKEIYPGAVYNIRGSRAKSLIKENLSRAIKGDDKSLGKEVFYLGGEWEVVSESLYQTSGELEIIRSISSNIASEIPVGSVIVELGPRLAVFLP